MGWVYDVGYEPAYQHEGWAASVLTDGKDTGSWSTALAPRITGWRAACECGWRGSTLYARSEWPSKQGLPPDEVEGWESDTGCFSEWEAHVKKAVAELELYELLRTIEKAQRRVPGAVQKAREAGASWTTIGRAAGITSRAAEERWAGF